MECYEGVKMIKTFRGKIADGSQDTIVLHTNDGGTGYRIAKFSIMTAAPGTLNGEFVTKIYKTSQATIDGAVDFSDNQLLGAATLVTQSNPANNQQPLAVIFDTEIFNQDIYVTHFDADSSNAINYYIELEQVKLDLNQSTVATLKDIRNELRIPPG